MKEAWRDPGLRAAVVLVMVAAAGLAAIGLAWRGVAATLAVYTQVPFLVSGACGGVALAGAAIAILTIHLDRRDNAEERAALDELIESFTDMAD